MTGFKASWALCEWCRNISRQFNVESEPSAMSFVLLILAVLSILQCGVSLAPRSGANEPVAAAWYAAWHATTGFPLSAVSWDKYNTLIYSFA